jgi:tetratricopeptide (TPR) repeat protein
MQVAPDEGAARALSGEMWEIWLDAPDELAQAMLDEGLALLQTGAHASSRRVLSRLVDYCAEYPEGYNQRAFAAFLQGDYEAALVDLDAAIALQPVHLGALTGKALTLIRLGRDDEAQEVLRVALAINPWLSERALLDEPPGEDI